MQQVLEEVAWWELEIHHHTETIQRMSEKPSFEISDSCDCVKY